MQMTCGTDSDVALTASVACHNADIGQDTLRWTEDPNVMLCGMTSCVKLTKEQPNQKFAACFLLPGLYKMYIYDGSVYQRQGVPAFNHSVRPAYFLVA